MCRTRPSIAGPTDLRCSYFTSVFVSLGVFLFGYDQGVMSGIITLVSSPPGKIPNVSVHRS